MERTHEAAAEMGDDQAYESNHPGGTHADCDQERNEGNDRPACSRNVDAKRTRPFVAGKERIEPPPTRENRQRQDAHGSDREKRALETGSGKVAQEPKERSLNAV